ncbi:hypothetical protein V6C53_19210 [Desulfocurvibacter africanus]|uniref:hypothetical protein n=1 Tax=Desulfocurvibacter africanus TaxID=873 RepID=UPI002FDB2974
MTGLETILIGAGSLFVGSVGTWLTLSKLYVSKRECELQTRGLVKQSEKLDHLYSMMREVIMCLPIDNKEKARILNMRPIPRSEL